MPYPTTSRKASLVAVALAASLLVARADQVTLQDGKVLNGEITAEDANSLTLRISDGSSTIALTRRINKAQVKSVSRPPRQGPPYVLVPVHGEVGRDVTFASLQAGLGEAARANPKYILLDIDSPGGSISEMIRILDLLDSARHTHAIVAYVHNAYSAAAIIAMSCPQIYLAPNGVIGAAVPFKATKNGPVDVEAKVRSAIEAKGRAYVTAAGHDPLFLHGMMDMGSEIYLSADAAGHPVLAAEGPGKCIKSKGTILTLTATEAAESGLSHTAADLPDLGKQLTGGPWYEATRIPWDATLAAAAAELRSQRERAESVPGLDRDRAAIARVKPDLEANVRQIIEVNAKIQTNADAINNLRDQVEAGKLRIVTAYREALSHAKTQADVARAQDARDGALADLATSTQAAAEKLKSEGDALYKQLKQLRAHQKELLATLPTN